MDPDHARYVERILNDERSGAVLIRVTDQLLPGAAVPDVQTVQLAGGNDGLVGLDDTDFVGSDAGTTGLHALDQVQYLSLLLVPGRATAAVALCAMDDPTGARELGPLARIETPRAPRPGHRPVR